MPFTLRQIREKSDDKKWAAAQRYVAAVNNLRRATRAYGAISTQATLALEEAQAAEREFKRLQKL